MAKIYDQIYFGGKVVPKNEASLSVASSAVLYGLSVYTVFPVLKLHSGKLAIFRLSDHYQRLVNSCSIIGIDTFRPNYSQEKFLKAVKAVISKNNIAENVFIRATVHVDELVPGTRSRGLKTIVSIFAYEAIPILPQNGARLKTSVWRRVPDFSIPSRAKVNGAYVNSVLAKQDAIDSGYDDCVLLDTDGHVCELSAANIFIVRSGKLITPSATSDLLEGINRSTVIEIAKDMGIETEERSVDLTELYIADEVFASGTSAYIAPIVEVDARAIGGKKTGPITSKIKQKYQEIIAGKDATYNKYLTNI